MAEYKSNYTGEQIDTAIAKANTALQEELEPSFNASASKNITSQDITNWNNKAEVSDIPDVSNFITKDVNDLTYYELATATGNSIVMSIDSSTYVLTVSLKNSAGTILNTQTVDLPLETMVVGGSYDSVNKKIVLTLKNGNTIEFSVADLIGGLQSEITSNNKLSSDLVDDTNNTNKFTNASEKQAWNGKYAKPIAGIPKTDLAQAVQDSLDLADSAIQSNDLASVATSGDYDDLINKPTIPKEINLEEAQYEDMNISNPFIFSTKKIGIYFPTTYPTSSQVSYFKKNAESSSVNLSGQILYIVIEKDVNDIETPSVATNFAWCRIISNAGTFYQAVFYIDTDGTMKIQSKTYASSGELVIPNTQQTFSGIKSFSVLPELIAQRTPTKDVQLTPKKYVDDSIAGIDLTAKEDVLNKVTSLDSTSTDTQYPSAKCVWDLISSMGSDVNFESFQNDNTHYFSLYNKKKGIYVNKSFNYGLSFYYDQSPTVTYQQAYRRTYLMIIINKDIEIDGTEEEVGIAIGVISNDNGGKIDLGKLCLDYVVKKTAVVQFQSSSSVTAKFLTNDIQTIGGVKTFNSIPKLASYTAPTSNEELVAKKYVDDSIASAITTTLNGNY